MLHSSVGDCTTQVMSPEERFFGQGGRVPCSSHDDRSYLEVTDWQV